MLTIDDHVNLPSFSFTSLLTAVAVCTALSSSSSSSQNALGDHTTTAPFDIHRYIHRYNSRVDFISSQLDRYEQQVADLKSPPDNFVFYSTLFRVVHLEAYATKTCGARHVSCGGGRPTCVHQLLVCDGVRDCHNGRDEDEVICEATVLATGTTLRGVVHWHRCLALRDHYMSITIMTNARSPFFRSRSTVTAIVNVDPDDDDSIYSDSDDRYTDRYSYTVSGSFTYATQQLAVSGRRVQDGGAYSFIICNFNRGDNEKADCKLVLESTHTACAFFQLDRVY